MILNCFAISFIVFNGLIYISFQIFNNLHDSKNDHREFCSIVMQNEQLYQLAFQCLVYHIETTSTSEMLMKNYRNM